MTTRFLQMSLTIAFVFAIGCGVQPATLDAISQVAASSARVPPDSTSRVQMTRVSAKFDPSYPDRVDPFSFPDNASSNDPGIENPIQSAAQVEVMGFADLGQSRVFLRARDQTHSLAIGDKVQGVEVVEISPPSVRLRMGSLTWTISMFDKVSQ